MVSTSMTQLMRSPQ